MTPLSWLFERPLLAAGALTMALATWAAVILLASREPPEQEAGQCMPALVGSLEQ